MHTLVCTMGWIQRRKNSRGILKARYIYLSSLSLSCCFHTLIAFQTDEIDELFNFSDDLEESSELQFDAAELEKIEMLDSYRDKLVTQTDEEMMVLPDAN